MCKKQQYMHEKQKMVMKNDGNNMCCAREKRETGDGLLARFYNELMSFYVSFVWSVFFKNAQEMVMMIGSRRGMQHDDVVRENVEEGYAATMMCEKSN